MEKRLRNLERAAQSDDVPGAVLRLGIAKCRAEGHPFKTAQTYAHPYDSAQYIEVQYCSRCLDARVVSKPAPIVGPRDCGAAIFDCRLPQGAVDVAAHMASSVVFAKRLINFVWEDVGYLPDDLRWVATASVLGLLRWASGYKAPEEGPGSYAGIPLYLRPPDDRLHVMDLCVGPHQVGTMQFVNH